MSTSSHRETRAEQEAARLRREWEARARTPHGRFFIASSPGWSDESTFFAGGRADCGFVTTGLSAEFLRAAHTLEIGCGVGRLALPLAAKVRSYTGVDISATYLEEAQRTCAHLPNTRFALSNGVSLPESCQDRRYDFIFAAAVFIHCPEDVIAAWIKAASLVLAKGGEFRFQLLGDPLDHMGIECGELNSQELTQLLVEHEEAVQNEALEMPDAAHCQATGYMGAQFTWERAQSFLAEQNLGPFVLYRPNPAFIYGAWRATEL